MATKECERKLIVCWCEFNNYMSMLRKQKNGDSCVTGGDSYIKVDHYYDTPVFTLQQKNETLRVRQKGDNLTLERKYNKVTDNSVACSDEAEDANFQGPLPMKIVHDNVEYQYIGSLTTYRTDFKVGKLTISFDINFYLGSLDYEIEIEGPTPEDIVNYTEIRHPDEKIASKYQRFCLSLKHKSESSTYIANFLDK